MVLKILVPTDTSKTAHEAVEYAIALAKQTNASISLLNVIDKSFIVSQSIPGSSAPTHLIEPIEDYLRQAAEAYMEEVERLCQNNRVQMEKLIRSGYPVEEIMKAVEEIEVVSLL